MQPVLRTIRQYAWRFFVNTRLANIEHLRKQAKDLLRLYRRDDAAAFERLRAHLPVARGKNDAALSAASIAPA